MTMVRAALIVTAASAIGCGGRQDSTRFIPSPQVARVALAAALDAWKEGRPTGRLPGVSPSVHVVDETRKTPRLTRYDILGVVPGDGPPTFNVVLETDNTSAKQTARYVVVGIDPLWVFRQEDFDKMAHWEMDMKHDEADDKESAKKPDRAP
jgi:hypothetical protein